MPLRRRKKNVPAPPAPPAVEQAQGPPPDEIVRMYLHAQNLEQVQQIDEAITIYEQAVAARFDAAGPYDRLIALYSGRDAHADVRRIAEAALSSVRTFDEKKAWYTTMRDGAAAAERNPSDGRGAEF